MIRAVLLCGLLSLSALAQLPNPKLTPGATLKVRTEEICKPGYSKKARKVSTSTKRYVSKMYGIPYQPRLAEMDHLIPIELSGSNTVNNLWPESYAGEWGARKKDRLENRLHSLVCSGSLDLKTAQNDIASNWVTAYRKYVRTY
jgi:hypothetical protein